MTTAAERECTRSDAGTLSDWQLPEVYQQENSKYFPSDSSLLWFIRQHRQELASAGALARICGRIHVNAPRITQLVITIGQRAVKA